MGSLQKKHFLKSKKALKKTNWWWYTCLLWCQTKRRRAWKYYIGNSSYASKEHVSSNKFQSFYSQLFSCENPMQIENMRKTTIEDSMLDGEFDFQEFNLRGFCWCDSNKTISEFQSAYKKGTGCEDHIFTLSAIIQNQVKYKKNVMYALFIDLTKAFDSINHEKLWAKLYVAGLSSHFISMIQIVYKNAKAKVRTSHGGSEYFPINRCFARRMPI
jgi:hypothetical protein